MAAMHYSFSVLREWFNQKPQLQSTYIYASLFFFPVFFRCPCNRKCFASGVNFLVSGKAFVLETNNEPINTAE